MDHRRGVTETPDGPLFPVAAVPGLPSLHAITTPPLGARVFGFTASGYDALDWWRRLREAHAATGYWPVLMGHGDPEYLANSYEYADPPAASRWPTPWTARAFSPLEVRTGCGATGRSSRG